MAGQIIPSMSSISIGGDSAALLVRESIQTSPHLFERVLDRLPDNSLMVRRVIVSLLRGTPWELLCEPLSASLRELLSGLSGNALEIVA